MQEAGAIAVAKQAIVLALQVAGPALAVMLIVGVLVGVFQTVTQVQEQTLTFAPKVLAFVVVLLLLGPWMLHLMVGFTSGTFSRLPGAVR